jgi:hypothetical protein
MGTDTSQLSLPNYLTPICLTETTFAQLNHGVGMEMHYSIFSIPKNDWLIPVSLRAYSLVSGYFSPANHHLYAASWLL